MKAVVLAGGYGTRLYPITLRTPKPLLPIAGKPVVRHTIESLAKSGVTAVVVSIKENQGKIADCIGGGTSGCKVSYVFEPAAGESEKLGSVGALEYVFSKMGKPTECFVVGGDNYFHGLDFRKLREFHSGRRAHATIALYDVGTAAKASHYGVAAVDKQGRITKFIEKPPAGSGSGTLVSTAAYYLADNFLCEHIPGYCAHRRRQGKPADRIGDLWEHYLDSLQLYGFAFNGLWGDIGNAENYLETNAAALSLSKKPSIIAKGAKIGKNAVIGPGTSILHHSTIGANCVVAGSVVFERTKIGAGTGHCCIRVSAESPHGIATVLPF